MARRAVLLSVLLACGKSQGTLQISTGQETDVFTKAPAPTHFVVEAFDTNGNATRLGEGPIAPGTIDLAEQQKVTVATLRITARDDSDAILAQGSSLLMQLGVLSDRTLEIFVQRRGELARMPGVLGDARETPLLSVAVGRYVFVAGESTSTQLYDLMSLVTYSNPPTMPFVPQSIAPVDVGVVLVADDMAEAFDFSSSGHAPVNKPAGGTWSDVSSGPTVEGDKGAQFVVGAARTTGAPTDKILQLKQDGTAAFLRLGQARLGAATCFVPGRGLLVIGGATSGFGVEVVPATDSMPIPMSNFGAIPQTGVAALLSGSKIALGGSDGSTSTLDLACQQSCAPVPTGMPGDPIVQMLNIGDDVLVLRRAMDGTMHAFRFSSGQEVPFKIARKNARALRLPTGNIAIVGGSNVIESFAF